MEGVNRATTWAMTRYPCGLGSLGIAASQWHRTLKRQRDSRRQPAVIVESLSEVTLVNGRCHRSMSTDWPRVPWRFAPPTMRLLASLAQIRAGADCTRSGPETNLLHKGARYDRA